MFSFRSALDLSIPVPELEQNCGFNKKRENISFSNLKMIGKSPEGCQAMGSLVKEEKSFTQ